MKSLLRIFILYCFFSVYAFAKDRVFEPSEGFTLAEKLPDSVKIHVRSIQLNIKDAFEGAKVNSEVEAYVFDIGNKLHIESKPYTIRRRLLFKEGDTINKDKLLETERALRNEEFLADAKIEVKIWEDSTAHIIVTTFDQWTTTLAASLNRDGGEWQYWFGPVESNVLGSGQKLGFFMGHTDKHDLKWLDYKNNAFLPWKLQLGANGVLYSDGYGYAFSLAHPLLSRSDKYAFSISMEGSELSETVYFDANDYEEMAKDHSLSDSAIQAYAKKNHTLLYYNRIATHNTNVTVTRSYGDKLKLNPSLTYDRSDRYQHGSLLPRTDALALANQFNASDYKLDERTTDLAGLSLSLYQYEYKTVRNFRNLKWSENLDVGWRLSSKLAKNLNLEKNIAGNQYDWYLSHTAVFNNAWMDAHFVNSNVTTNYFITENGRLNNGYAHAGLEYYWRQVETTGSFLSVQWSNLFAVTKTQQLLLGEETDLHGYPNYYYAGQARFIMSAEQRLFTPWEMGTFIPAFAAFVNAGNTYKSYNVFDPQDLHYSVGLGMRLGASKSVQKVVNHLNFAWPLDRRLLKGPYYWPTFSLQAKKSL